MFKYVLQLIVGFLGLLGSMAVAWYEGSGIIDNSLEWKYSTPFSKIFNIEITNGRDISQLDYFVYAAKYQPLFPTIMVISGLYIVIVMAFFIHKHNRQFAIYLSGITSCLLMVTSSLLINASTVGGRIFFVITAGSALFFICIAVSAWFRSNKLQLVNQQT
ncbi:YjdJ family protein [Lysinibacillus sp. NPDC097287]|uniref:YjdJ family protein n=1 Tax=Lysinibacillus sp. NPDC097287 TaxID=3364144 RepID=UPI00382120B3